ncbi:homeostatic regulator of DAG [Diutina catenulata]
MSKPSGSSEGTSPRRSVSSADASPALPLAGTGTGVPQDIPPDMVVLLQQLEADFANKEIDQWTYINRREQIMNSVSRMHEQQAQMYQQDIDPDQLEQPLYPRKSSELDATKQVPLTKILKSRAGIYRGEIAISTLDGRGKDVSSITWEKLYAKAVKVASEIQSKMSLKNSDTVVLIYKDGEVCEFAVALYGCFMAGVTAIPIHQDIYIAEVMNIIKLTSTKLVLYSETCAKDLEKLNSPNSRVQWPPKVVKWRTTDFGSAKKSELAVWDKRIDNDPQTGNLAYVEFSRSPVGELRGIALSQRTILHQMNCLEMTLSSLPSTGGALQRTYTSAPRNYKVVLATLDIRFSIGIILGMLFTVYSGNLLVWAPSRTMEVPGLYAHITSRVRASLLLADYFNLKRVTYDYQKNPNSTRNYSKTQNVDFSSVKWVLVNALTIDGEFMEILANRYLRPLGCQHPDTAIIPMLTLSEYGGMVISLRDWVGNNHHELASVVIDKEALSRNRVTIVENDPSGFDEISPEHLRVDAFGYPLPDATLAVVNPETLTLVNKGELGEIWIDSPCLSGGFYGLKKESKQFFHARCRGVDGVQEMDFLRTGLLGFTYDSRVYVLGLYEDRIRQRISWMDQQLYAKMGRPLVVGNGFRYHYSSHLLATLASEVSQVYDCTIFDVFIGNEYLPVAIVEAEIISKVLSEDKDGDGKHDKDKGTEQVDPVPLNEPVLNSIAQRCFDTLYKRHMLRLYCVVVVDCDTLPKITRSGGKEIANMLCKKKFLDGSLRAEFVKFFVRKSISMIPHGDDVIGGVWSPYVSTLRTQALAPFARQISTIDYREKSIDDRTGAPLTDFKSIIDVLKFRVGSSGDSIAFQNIDNNGKSSKPLTWKKFETRVYALCHYFIEKGMVKPKKYLVLMYSLSEEFVIAVFACFLCGIIPIPLLPFDSNRIREDFPAFAGVIADFAIDEIMVNEDVEKFLKNGPVADSLKRMNAKRARPLKIKNTAKLTKLSIGVASLNSRLAKFQAQTNFRDQKTVALVWLNFTSDHYRVGATLSHHAIMGICKVFKETCNLSSRSAIVGCVRHSSGIGFIQACLLGVYLGTTTYLSSPVHYAENPLAFYLALARYKVKDVFVTEQMLKYAAIKFTPKGFNLATMKNMMISTEGRVEYELLRKIAKVFAPAKLSPATMSTVYNHYFNPMVASRSYATVAPVELYLDPVALRQGYVSVVNQADYPNALLIQDSGMVPVCTEVAIVNPETCQVCHEGEFGEIWVSSDANLTGFTNGPKGPHDKFVESQFRGVIAGGDPSVKYIRTGDLGFLHTISITKTSKGADEATPEVASFQPLFVLGKIADTFEVMGLHHFPIDVENTIEACHPDIYNNGSCVFKCADFTVVVCESRRQRYFASLVPLIVNTVLSKHHLIVDIVAFIRKGEFPISRLGTKQRARIVDAWVNADIPIVASYGVNYGENSMIQLVKEIDVVARDHPITGLRNPAASYYDDEPAMLDGEDDGPLEMNIDHVEIQ